MAEWHEDLDWENSTQTQRDAEYKRQKIELLGNEDDTSDRCGWLKRKFAEWGVYGESILDVGCKDGYTTRSFLRNKCEILGIDICDDAIRVAQDEARKRYPDGRWSYVCAEFSQINWPEFESDYVVCFEVIEHLPYDKVGALLQIFHRAAKRAVLISTPTKHGKYGDSDDNKSHINLYVKESLDEQILKETDMKAITVQDENFLYTYWRTDE